MNESAFSNEVASLLDQGIESLRWCRQHIGERGVTERLHLHLVSMTALTLALTYEMDGKLAYALRAVEYGDWRPPSTLQHDPERPE